MCRIWLVHTIPTISPFESLYALTVQIDCYCLGALGEIQKQAGVGHKTKPKVQKSRFLFQDYCSCITY